MQRRLQRKGQKVLNRFQTNATLLDQSWVNFVKQSEFHLGISFDGPERVHDHYRVYPSGKGSFTDVMRTVELLKVTGLNFGVLVVVTKESIGKAKEIHELFVGNGFLRFDFLPCAEIDHDTGQMTAPSVTPSQFADSMIEVFDLWMQDDNPEVSIRYFDNILMGLLGGKPRLCEFAGTCSNFITIDSNGDIYPCDSFIGDGGLKFGNIVDTDSQEIPESEKYKDFVEMVTTVKSECLKCEWYPICKGGCPHYRYMFRQNFFDRNYLCEARKRIFKHIKERVQRIITQC